MRDNAPRTGRLTPSQVELLREKFFAMVTTLMPDGSPQTTPIWVDTDGEHVLMNTAKSRVKARNLERDPRLSVAVLDPDKPYDRWVSVRGRAELIEEGAIEQIHALSRKYLGADYPWLQPGEQRVTILVHVERATGPI